MGRKLQQMNPPNLHRMMETFIPIPASGQALSAEAWQGYLNLLRSKVAPLVRDLMKQGKIDWYSFLVHDKESGVPAEAGDGLYVHLRFSLSPAAEESRFAGQLSADCRFTRKMPPPDAVSLGAVHARSLRNGDIAQGWKIFGEESELVLSLLDAHDPDQPVPPRNIGQLLHYLGNQVRAKAVGLPMP